MPATLVSDMSGGGAEALREFMAQRHAALWGDEVRGLIAGCSSCDMDLDRRSRLICELLDHAVEGGQLTRLLRELADGCESVNQVFPLAGDRVKSANIYPTEKAAFNSALERMTRRTRELGDATSSLLKWLEMPSPDVDPRALAGPWAALDSDDYVDMKDLTSMALTGKPRVKVKDFGCEPSELQFCAKMVFPYLIGLGLSHECWRILLNAFWRELIFRRNIYTKDKERRLAPYPSIGSDCMRVDFVFKDPVQRIYHRLRLIVSDAACLLRVLHAQDEVSQTELRPTGVVSEIRDGHDKANGAACGAEQKQGHARA